MMIVLKSIQLLIKAVDLR